MIQAAPLVLSFARAVPMLNKLVGAVGITELGNRVNNYIQENPEESEKIVSMIMPAQGIANALKNKSSEDVEEVEETEEVSTGSGVEEKIKEILVGEGVDIEGVDLGELPKDLQGKVMKGIAKSSSNKQKDMKEASAIIGLSGPARETKKMADEIDDRYEGGLEEVTKTKGYDFRDYIPKGAYKKRYADGGSIGIEVLFENKNPRQGLFMGGSPLEGQALNIYNSMNAYNFTDQQIADALSAQGLYTAGGTTDTPDTTIQPIGFQSGNGGGGGGITELDPLNRPKGTPFDLNSLTKTKFGYNNALGRTIEGVKDFTGSMIDKFSGSKIGEGITSGATKFKNMAFTPMMALMQKRNPLNPSATNYNPNLQKQMDFLEGTTGTRVFGTSDNLQFEDAAMIGRDPNSGLAKYGPGSVLSGQNVVSGFGTNDYEEQLANYVEKMRNRAITKTLTKFQQQKLDAAMAELGREKARQEKDAADKARAANADVYAELDKRTGGKGYGDAGGFSTSRAGKEGAFGTFGEGRGRKDFSEGGLATMFKEKR